MKWPGGKRRLVREILARIPDGVSGRYFEPFVGGGAVFFEARQLGRVKDGVLGDLNQELIVTYGVVRDDVEALIAELRRYSFSSDFYAAIRDVEPACLGRTETAARLIYLSKTGYNGLYRVNGAGRFNVSIGTHENPCICDADALRAASRALTGVELRHADFIDGTRDAVAGDVAYFDPPYVGGFTEYTKERFPLEQQVRLRDHALELRERGVHVVLSNSDHPIVHELYAGFTRSTVSCSRSINSNPNGRGPVGELLIS